MTIKLTNSQIAEQYVYTTYPCIPSWIAFAKSVIPYVDSYNQVSCSQVSMISNAAMKAFDYMMINESNCKIVRVSRMMNDMYYAAWSNWTLFNAQSRQATGDRTMGLTSASLQALASFTQWDNVLNTSPSFSPPALLYVVLEGVQP